MNGPVAGPFKAGLVRKFYNYEEKTGPNPADRGKDGVRRSLLCDGGGAKKPGRAKKFQVNAQDAGWWNAPKACSTGSDGFLSVGKRKRNVTLYSRIMGYVGLFGCRLLVKYMLHLMESKKFTSLFGFHVQVLPGSKEWC